MKSNTFESDCTLSLFNQYYNPSSISALTDPQHTRHTCTKLLHSSCIITICLGENNCKKNLLSQTVCVCQSLIDSTSMKASSYPRTSSAIKSLPRQGAARGVSLPTQNTNKSPALVYCIMWMAMLDTKVQDICCYKLLHERILSKLRQNP